jgi:uncharacterized SAM-binding protein YcdF (DUF218 family)
VSVGVEMTKQDNSRQSPARRIIGRVGRVAVVSFATLFVIQVAVASCHIPELLMEWLSCRGMETEHQPQYVVLLGGSIPTQEGLMRAYYAAEFGKGRTGITYIVSMPSDEDPEDSGPARVRDELVLRGVPASDILFESKGLNTHQQAVFVRSMLGDNTLNQPLLIVTSPAHMRRALLCFRKQGFTRVACLSASDRGYAVDIGRWVFFRYTLWCRLQWQAEIAREFTALVAYKLRGWI